VAKSNPVAAQLEEVEPETWRASTYADDGNGRYILDIAQGRRDECEAWLLAVAPGIKVQTNADPPPSKMDLMIPEMQALLDKYGMCMFARIGRDNKPLISFIGTNGENWSDFERIYPDHVVKF
jgi:hypothetical protein